jgi:hypothetical protein
MISTDILFSPLAIAGFLTGVAVAFLAGRARQDPGAVIAKAAIGSGMTLAGIAWASAFGGGALFAALAVGFGASLSAIAIERSRRPTIH